MANHTITGPRPLPPRPPTPQRSSPVPILSHRRTRSTGRVHCLEPVMEGDPRLLREVQMAPPGDVRRRVASNPGVGRQKSQYFEDELGDRSKEPRDHSVRQDSMILCELKTSVIVKDERNLINDLVIHLSGRYHRPISSIVINLEHSAIIYFSGTFDPAYTVAVHTIASQAEQTVTNKRNLALLQRHLSHALGVPPTRGVVRYVGVPDECFGWGGNTVAGVVADKEMRSLRGRSSHLEVGKQSTIRALSQRLRRDRSQSRATRARSSPATKDQDDDRVRVDPEFPSEDVIAPTPDDKESSSTPNQKLKHKPSFIQTLFSRSSRQHAEANEHTR